MNIQKPVQLPELGIVGYEDDLLAVVTFCRLNDIKINHNLKSIAPEAALYIKTRDNQLCVEEYMGADSWESDVRLSSLSDFLDLLFFSLHLQGLLNGRFCWVPPSKREDQDINEAYAALLSEIRKKAASTL
jgi:hypothetical protein